MRHMNLRCLRPHVTFCPHVSSLTSSVIHAQLRSLHAESTGCSNKTLVPLKGQEDLHLCSKHQENPPAQQRIWKAGTRVPQLSKYSSSCQVSSGSYSSTCFPRWLAGMYPQQPARSPHHQSAVVCLRMRIFSPLKKLSWKTTAQTDGSYNLRSNPADWHLTHSWVISPHCR